MPARGRIDPYYTTQWGTRSFSLDVNNTYRIRVWVNEAVLGYADVWLVLSRGTTSRVWTVTSSCRW